MSISPALTSDEITALNGISTRLTYLSVVPNTTVATARVNGSLAYPIAQIPTTSESAGWTDVKKGMTLLIGTAAGLSDVAIFRVRENVAGTGAISVAEFGTNDVGAVARATITAIANAQYITVIDRKDIWAVFPRIDYGGGTTAVIYEDFNRTDITGNLLPSPIVNIKTNNARGGHFATKVADGGTVAITSIATVTHWPSSSSVSSYQWTYPAGFTGVSGATTATLTATAPVGNHEISCTVTPNLGAAITVYRRIHIHDDTTNPAIPIATYDSDTRNRTSRRVSLGLNNTAVTSIPDGAMCILFDVPTWNGTTVPTASTIFVGWLAQIGFSTGGGLRQAGPELVGVGEILGALTNTSQLFEVANVPTVWQQMGYNLATYNWVIWWILTLRASGVLINFNFYPYSTSASVGRQPSFDIGAGSLLSQVQSLAQRKKRGNVGTTSDGSIFVTIPAHMVRVADRGSLITRATLTASRVSSITWRRDLRPRIRQVNGEGFAWDGVSALPTPFKSIAPERPGQGASDDTLGEQIVDDQTDLDWITALYYAWVNNPIASVTVIIPGNWDVIEPAEGTLVNITVPAAYSPTGVEWQFDAVPLSVSKRPLGDGATETELTVEPLTSAPAKGTPVPVIPIGTNLIPDLPPLGEVFPLDPIPDWGPELPIDPDDEIPLDPLPDAPDEYPDMYGATDDGHVWKATNSVFTDISPTATQRTQIGTTLELVQDVWNYDIAFLIGTTGILRTTQINGSSVPWTALNRPGVTTPRKRIYDFEVNGQGWSAHTNPQLRAVYVAGTGWHKSPDRNDRVTIDITFPSPITITGVVVTLNDATGVANCGILYGSVSDYETPVGNTITQTGTSTSSTLFVDVVMNSANDPYIVSVEITTQGAGDPYGFVIENEAIIGSFRCSHNKKDMYCWLSRRTISSVDYVYFNRTMDAFRSYQSIEVATWATDMHYSIALNAHNWRLVHVTAGDPAGSDAFVYKSIDGGGSFTATDVELYIHGGQLFTNWSTGTPNTPNLTSANLIMIRGLDGSDDLLARRGLSGSDVTIANGAGKYGLQPDSLYQLARDGDYIRVVLQDNSVYISDDFGADYDAATSVGGTQLRGVWLWPTDDAFGILYGDEQLEYTIDTFSTYVDMWSDYDAFRSGAWGSEGETIVSAWIDLGQHYIRPVASEA